MVREERIREPENGRVLQKMWMEVIKARFNSMAWRDGACGWQGRNAERMDAASETRHSSEGCSINRMVGGRIL